MADEAEDGESEKGDSDKTGKNRKKQKEAEKLRPAALAALISLQRSLGVQAQSTAFFGSFGEDERMRENNYKNAFRRNGRQNLSKTCVMRRTSSLREHESRRSSEDRLLVFDYFVRF